MKGWLADLLGAVLTIALLPSLGWSQSTDRSAMDQWLKDSEHQPDLPLGHNDAPATGDNLRKPFSAPGCRVILDISSGMPARGSGSRQSRA